MESPSECEPIMADEGLKFTDTLQPAGNSSLDTEHEHSDTMSEILSLFQDSVPSSSHDLGYVISEDSLTDELRTLSGDELWTKTEDFSSPEEDAQPPPQKLMRLEEEHTAAEREAQETSPQAVETQQPTVLERLGLTTHAYEPSPLPPDWVAVVHSSGGVVYLHKPTRVCTWARPYHVKSGSIKKHRVPVQGIPCLEKWLFCKERNQLAEGWHQHAANRKGLLIKLEPPWLKEYLSMRWSADNLAEIAEEGNPPARSILGKGKKSKPKKQQPESLVPEDLSKVVHVKIPPQYLQHGVQTEGKKPPAVWSVNMSNKPAISLLYEFCHQYLRANPEFKVEETSSTQLPYLCTLSFGGIVYGSGQATTKKQAKHAAAEETLDLFLPGVFQDQLTQTTFEEEFKYFSSVAIDDGQVSQLLEQVGLPLPWQILKECCRRNQGLLQGELEFSLSPKANEKQQLEYKLSLGEHTVAGTCSSKKEGQQLGAQAILKKLHPYISNWGALLRIYSGKRKSHHRSLVPPTECDSSDRGKDMDQLVLNKLKQEMQKLADETKSSLQQRGTGPVLTAEDVQHRHLHLNTTIAVVP